MEFEEKGLGGSSMIPCYSSPAVQDDFRQKILKICKKRERSSDEDVAYRNYQNLGPFDIQF